MVAGLKGIGKRSSIGWRSLALLASDRIASMSPAHMGTWHWSNQDIYRLAVLISNLLSRNLATSTTASLSFRGASRNLRG